MTTKKVFLGDQHIANISIKSCELSDEPIDTGRDTLNKLESKAPLELSGEEIRMMQGALVSNATMLTAFGQPAPEQLELYRKLMNLSDKLGDTVDVTEGLV